MNIDVQPVVAVPQKWSCGQMQDLPKKKLSRKNELRRYSHICVGGGVKVCFYVSQAHLELIIQLRMVLNI